jgi:hypothetical protein
VSLCRPVLCANTSDDELDAAVEVSLKLVLPQANYRPFGPPQAAKVAGIPFSIARDFQLPERSHLVAPSREIETVPKVAVDKNDGSMLREDDIGPTGKRLNMRSKPQSTTVEC